MTKRRSIPLKTRLAATLCQMLRPNEKGELEPVIDFESAKNMTEDQVLSVFHFDHDPIPKHRDGPDEHWNLVPRPIPEHRVKTQTKDVPEAAKDKRITADNEAFRRRMLAKAGQGETEPPAKRRSAPIPGSKASPWKKKLNGEVVRR